MMISLHKNATTTPRIRRCLSGSSEPAAVLARRYGTSEETARKWKRRDSISDLSTTPHNLQTTLTPAQEAVVVQLRRLLLLPPDDLLAVTREFLNPDVSRSGLDRCLRRHGVSSLKALLPKTPPEARKTFKACAPGFLHVDLKYLPQMADEVICSWPSTGRHAGVGSGHAEAQQPCRYQNLRPDRDAAPNRLSGQ
jgi:hypothetical protein